MSGAASTGGRVASEPPNLNLAALHIAVTDLFVTQTGRMPTHDEVMVLVDDMRARAREEWRQEIAQGRHHG